MSPKALVILNSLSLVAVLVVNALVGTGKLGAFSIAEVSEQHESLFTPAGYTFSVWTLIYIGLIAHVIFQWVVFFRNEHTDVIRDSSWLLILANLANITWVLLWVNEWIGLSVLVMFVLLWSLVQLVFRHRLEIWDAPVRIIAFVWWPFAIYLGWIVAATVANIAVYLVASDWNGDPFTPVTWTIVMILVSTAIYLFLIFKRNLRESAIVGIWAFIGIGKKQWPEYPEIGYTVGFMSVVLVAIILYKAYQNRYYNPFLKLKRGES